MYTLAAADTIQAVAGTTTAITYTIDGMEYSVALGEVYKVLGQGQVATGAAAIYTVGASTVAFISEIRLVNTTGSLVSGIILYRGGTAASNQITGSFSIPAGGTALISFPGGMEICDNLGNLYTTGTNIFDTTAVGATTPGALSAAGTALTASHRDHTHQSPGGLASIAAATSGINNTETILTSKTLLATFPWTAGMTFRAVCAGVCTSSGANASNFRIRVGTAGNNTDAVAAVVTPTAAASGSAIPFVCELWFSVRTIGSGGTMIGGGRLDNLGVTGVSAATPVPAQAVATASINTTVQNIVQLSYVAAAGTTTCTFHIAFIELVQM